MSGLVYTDPTTEVFPYLYSSNLLPPAPGYTGPRNIYDFLKTLKKEGEHGAGFVYRTVHSEVLGWILSRVTGKQTLQMGTHSDWILGTAFSRDSKHVVSISRDMTMKLTEVATQRFIDNVTSITPGALKGGLMAVAIRPKTGKWFQKLPEDTPGVPRKIYDEILCAGADGVPRLYKMHREKKREIGDDANKIKDFVALPGRVSALAFNSNGSRFAGVSSLDGKGEVRIVDVESRKTVICEGITGPAYTVAWQPGDHVIASAGFDGVIWRHDAMTGKLLSKFQALPPTKVAVK